MSPATSSTPAAAVPTPPGAFLGDAAETFEQALERSGLVSAAALERATRVQARMEAPRPLAEILVELGELTAEQVDTVRRRRRTRMALVDILVEDGAFDATGAATYLAAKGKDPSRPDRALLLEGGLVTEEQYLRAIGAKLDTPFLEPEIGEIQTDLFKKVPFAYLMKNLVLPLRIDHNVLHVTVAAPEDDALVGEIERTYGLRAKRFCSTRFRITETLRTLERLRGKPADRDSYRIQYRELDRAFDGPTEAGEEAVQLVDYLLARAVEMEASDLHIEPTPLKVRSRVRIDGILHHLTDFPIDFTARVVARIKILARIDVTEKR
ncbi:MAG: hypothetical protein MUE41_05320, partial [Gemmatimonadaceae bacterium]|nr:hypothetical protein [Gemmatimonadaceae bacterium]